MKKHRYVFLCLAWLLTFVASAQFNKSSYYSKAVGKKGAALKTALASIISSHTSISYDGLYDAYKTTDLRPDGKIWDVYSCTTNYDPDRDRAGNYSKEGDCFNREHSIPQSVFGEKSPMKTDVYHVIPTDGYVNNRRSNYCFGEVDNVEYQSNKGFSKLGSPSAKMKAWGCKESRVFEPNDEYKGDEARIYFYFVTCYESKMSTFGNYGMFTKTTYPALSEWADSLLLNWAEFDKVSEKETERLEAAYKVQKNRNPFIDFPGLEQYIWGKYVDVAFSVDDYVNPYENPVTPDTPDTPDNPDMPDNPDTPDNPDQPDTPDVPSYEGDYAYVKVLSEPVDWTGEYLIIYEEGSLALNGAAKTLDAEGNGLHVDIRDNVVLSSDEVDAAAFKVSQNAGAATYLVANQIGSFIGMSSSSNGLETSDARTYPCSLAVSGGGYADLVSNLSGTKMYLRYNKAAHRFRFYKSGQEPIALYKKTYSENPETSVERVEEMCESQQKGIFDMMGRRLNAIPTKGIYIMNGRKYVR